jgi:major membrane immunogen (membrane-anchored lipoprotein)
MKRRLLVFGLLAASLLLAGCAPRYYGHDGYWAPRYHDHYRDHDHRDDWR